MYGDYLEGWGRYVEVSEPGVLQVVEITLSQSVPKVDNMGLNIKAANLRKINYTHT